MNASEFVRVLIERDGLSESEAVDIKAGLIDDLLSGELEYSSLEEVLMDDYGLEPDYIFEFL